MIGILWTIRKSGSISYPALFEEVFGQKLDHSDDNYHTTKLNMQQIFSFHNSLLELYRNGMIETTEPIPDEDVISLFQSYDPAQKEKNIELRVAKRIAFIQYLFKISLTKIIQKGYPLLVHPIFGEPTKEAGKTDHDVFVIMPFREKLQAVYTDAIKPAIEDSKLSVRRGDDFFSDDRIMDEVWSAINSSKLCIADLTGNNPNVFYELGIAHTLGKPSILISQDEGEIAFDIRDRRVIIYVNDEAGIINLRDTLQKTIEAEMLQNYGETNSSKI